MQKGWAVLSFRVWIIAECVHGDSLALCPQELERTTSGAKGLRERVMVALTDFLKRGGPPLMALIAILGAALLNKISTDRYAIARGSLRLNPLKRLYPGR
jgi:hypothetical protein